MGVWVWIAILKAPSKNSFSGLLVKLKVPSGKNRVVYLQEVSVAGLTMAQLPQLKKQVYDIMTVGLIKYQQKN